MHFPENNTNARCVECMHVVAPDYDDSAIVLTISLEAVATHRSITVFTAAGLCIYSACSYSIPRKVLFITDVRACIMTRQNKADHADRSASTRCHDIQSEGNALATEYRLTQITSTLSRNGLAPSIDQINSRCCMTSLAAYTYIHTYIYLFTPYGSKTHTIYTCICTFENTHKMRKSVYKVSKLQTTYYWTELTNVSHAACFVVFRLT